MRELEIKRAVRTCTKCTACYGTVEETCPMNVESGGIRPFSPPGIFHVTDGMFQGYIEMVRERSTALFSCTMCGACAKRCGASQLHFTYEYPTQLIEGIRGMFIEAGEVPEQIAEVLNNVYSTKNAWRLPKSERVEWERGEISISDYREKPNEFLLFIGDASLIPETKHVPRVIAELLQKGGIDFGTLKEDEVDSGNEVREMGERGLFEELVRDNIEIFKQFAVRKVITISPHDYHTFWHDYPKLGAEFEGVYHYTQVISDLIRGGGIKLIREIPKTVTFQDPCHLGRYNGIYDAPRDIVKAIPGIQFVEMPRTRDDAFCCGAGGGRMWYDPEDAKQRISDTRVRHAKEVGADVIATACPYCLVNLQAAGNLGEISIQDVAELVIKSVSD
jgi:Fe-S oxidoreductase